MADPVDHPPHYNAHPSGVECIDVIESLGFLVGNAIKYLWRYQLKHGLQDLQKARWYVERELDRRERDSRSVGRHTQRSDAAFEKWYQYESEIDPSSLKPDVVAIFWLFRSVELMEHARDVIRTALVSINDLISEEVRDRAGNA